MAVLTANKLITIDGAVAGGKQKMKPTALDVTEVSDALAAWNLWNANQVKVALYSTSNETLSVTPASPQSPGTNIAIVPGTVPENVTYNGSLTIAPGVVDQEIKFNFGLSLTSTINNVVVSGVIYKNGSPFVQRILRKIATGADVGAASLTGVIPVSRGDTLDFYAGVDNATDLTILAGASWTFETFRLS